MTLGNMREQAGGATLIGGFFEKYGFKPSTV
jgi:hypothetical protein